LKAITYLARLNPCLNRQDYELEFCIYGYYYPSIIMGSNGKEPSVLLLGSNGKEPSVLLLGVDLKGGPSARHRDQASEEGEVEEGRTLLRLEGQGRFLSCGHITRVERHIEPKRSHTSRT
jgi:hypothetical protein